MDKDGPETMREAVARAIAKELTGGFPSSPKSIDHKAADAAIRTVLERLDDPTDAMVEAGNRTAGREAQWHCDVADIFRAMLAAITPPLPESADSGR